MEFLRYSRDVWGKTVLEGMSWDLFWYFIGFGIVFMVFHTIYMLLVNKTKDHT